MSRFIQDNFVAAWQSMRDVPRLTIDFGDGRRLERTLRGNVATYLCTSDGHVIDIVPGLCDPRSFLDRLRDAARIAAMPPDHAEQHTRWKHEAALAQIQRTNVSTPPSPRLPDGRPVDRSKVRVESRSLGAEQLVEAIPPYLDPRAPAFPDAFRRDVSKGVVESSVIGLGPLPLVSAQSPDRALLLSDSRTNRAERDPLVHALLSTGWTTPHAIEKHVFSEILHCDLDDPWLGMAEGPFGGGAYDGFDRVEPDSTPK